MYRQTSNRPTRRAFLHGAAISTLLARAGTPAAIYAYVGSYTTAQRYARGDGIHAYRIDPESGAWTHVQHVGNLVNPSFLVMRRDQRCLYAAHGDESYATSYSVDRQSGRLTPLGRAETGGRNGVHLAEDPSGRFLLVANYSTGDVAVIRAREDGTLGDLTRSVKLPGQPGPHRVEQASSHPHQILFDLSGRFVVVPDKGLDRVFVFAFDRAAGTLTPTAQGSGVARSGSGPRHAAFHPALPVLWVLNEIHSTIATYYWEAERGHLRPVQTLSTLPPDFTGESTASEIAVSLYGRFVYCSNRGHDSIARFAADPGTGLLSPAGWTSSEGRTPRFVAFDPSHRLLYAANEQSDDVRAWRVDPATGRLTAAGIAARNSSPVTIAFAAW